VQNTPVEMKKGKDQSLPVSLVVWKQVVGDQQRQELIGHLFTIVTVLFTIPIPSTRDIHVIWQSQA
jgi:hypothetical protein